MVKNYAILNSDNVAINFVVWDGVTAYDFGADIGNKIIEIPEGVGCGRGWIYADGQFIPPATSE